MWSMKVLFGFWIAMMLPLWTTSLSAKVYLTRDDALKQAFPVAGEIERKTLFLTDDEVKRIEALSKTRLASKIFTYYVGIENEKVAGYAFLGSHIVRTKPEVYMIVINQDGSLRRVEILAFYEPEEYLPSKRWFNQFQGKTLDDSLWPKRGVNAVSGATLSVNGITAEVRKILAIFEIKIKNGRVIR